jgi:hypothetical protein
MITFFIPCASAVATRYPERRPAWCSFKLKQMRCNAQNRHAYAADSAISMKIRQNVM